MPNMILKLRRTLYSILIGMIIAAILFLGACILRSLHVWQDRPQVFTNAQLVNEVYHAAN